MGMKNYYEVLQINEDASFLEIKKAYFALVRKYPADRFPEEFMMIREAYEILSNEKTRQEYDQLMQLSNIERQFFQESRRMMQEGNIRRAIQLLEEILRHEPHSVLLRGLLGEAYLQNGNSGKAIKILEKLVKENPKNAGFKGHLAHAYLERGWHKKAVGAYEAALEADEDNLSLWIGLSNAYVSAESFTRAENVLLKALDQGADKDWDNTGIYLNLIQININIGNRTNMGKYAKQLTKEVIEKEELREHVGWILSQLSKALVSYGWIQEALIILEEVIQLIPDNKELQDLKREVASFGLVEKEFERLIMDDLIREEVRSLLELEVLPKEITGVEGKYKENMIFLVEFRILSEIHLLKKSIQRLKKEYPLLYEKKASFFEKAMDNKRRKKMLKDYEKQQSAFHRIFREVGMDAWDEEDFDEEDFVLDDPYLDFDDVQEPFVREEPKVGRNEPCPCGSGKKYKKCCGR